ncbi:sigma-70 family RNA polymerase sigma factor [Solihabitans fulvus]|uniref:RNA polymerase sigma factor n=1 Tax=Solihabitans fulvus TaxID=1892852 RepID=A0A5B2WSE0_9PSEU|nr:sigma-70 family RNA polymerase sigma factor [Solihabitans fulvus]KAA2253612.1 sigma-70 family RNA polymerase sigma factor [Solihabitans fulvus]
MDSTPERGEDVVTQLYGRWRGPLLGYVLRSVGGDYQYAEDIVQETLLRAWRHSDSLTPELAGPWLYTVARNLVVSGYRRKGARVAEVPMEPADLPPVSDEVDKVLRNWQVAEAMRALSVEHRTVVVELFYRRRTVAEAATVLGIPVGTVKSRSYYALRALRGALEERGVTEP